MPTPAGLRPIGTDEPARTVTPAAPSAPVATVPTHTPEPAPPVVSEEVERAATTLATKVWSSGARPRDQLLPRLNQATAEEFVAYAVHRNWLRVDGDQIIRGSVDPQPAVTFRSLTGDGSRAYPGEMDCTHAAHTHRLLCPV